jgi:sterol desaturase/sphingolipid hydroxylase (fatty acid hydroxylase superfamily)
MENEVAMGASLPPNLVYLYTLLAMTFFIALEALLPRRELRENLVRRWGNNFSLAIITLYVSNFVSVLFVLYLLSWVDLREIGLLHYFGTGPLLSFAMLLLVSQFLSYIVHVAFHRIPWLWPIHAVHHTDVEIDVSTSYRHHVIEPLVSLPLVAPMILALGPSIEVGVAYKLFEITMAIFSHSNVRLPEGLDKVLRRFILTPDFHRLHHCAEQRFTNSNYGNAVPWFDYLFGTATERPYQEQESMELGLEYLREPRDSWLDRLILTPLILRRKQPDTNKEPQ